MVEGNETFAVFVLVESSFEDDFAEGRVKSFLAGAIELILVAIVDDGIIASFVLLDIGFESFGGGDIDDCPDDFGDMFGVVECQGLVQCIAVLLLFILDFGKDCVYNFYCFQRRLLS